MAPTATGEVLFGRAEFSEDRRYRYGLWRVWDDSKPMCAFVMLNPSDADETRNDPTVRRCMGFARGWGYGSLAVANLHALVSSNPKVLAQHDVSTAVGPLNGTWLARITAPAGLVVAAWGAHRLAPARYERMRGYIVGELHCIGTTVSGAPVHPLRQRRELVPYRWAGRAR